MAKCKIDKKQLDLIAEKKGYSLIDYQDNILMASYAANGVRINVYLTTGTIATALDHPKKGKTQLFRRGLDVAQIEKIFENPRQHTGKGYFKKHK